MRTLLIHIRQWISHARNFESFDILAPRSYQQRIGVGRQSTMSQTSLNNFGDNFQNAGANGGRKNEIGGALRHSLGTNQRSKFPVLLIGENTFSGVLECPIPDRLSQRLGHSSGAIFHVENFVDKIRKSPRLSAAK
ncbi:hypothetical protein D3C72_1125810 [compost metagenome]